MKCIDCHAETDHVAPCGLAVCEACCDACYRCDEPCADREPPKTAAANVGILFLETPSCRKCKGTLRMDKYGDTQSPCYHCPSVATAVETQQATQRARRKAIPENTKSKIIALYNGGMSRTGISVEVGLKKHQIDGFIKRAKHKGLISARKAVPHEAAETV